MYHTIDTSANNLFITEAAIFITSPLLSGMILRYDPRVVFLQIMIPTSTSITLVQDMNKRAPHNDGVLNLTCDPVEL